MGDGLGLLGGKLARPCLYIFSVEDGRRIRFGKDKGCEENALCVAFPSLYILAASKDTWVSEVLDFIERGQCPIWRLGCFEKRLTI